MLKQGASVRAVMHRAMAGVVLVAMMVGFALPATAGATGTVITPEMITIEPRRGP